jgi:hypothetical protein
LEKNLNDGSVDHLGELLFRNGAMDACYKIDRGSIARYERHGNGCPKPASAFAEASLHRAG